MYYLLMKQNDQQNLFQQSNEVMQKSYLRAQEIKNNPIFQLGTTLDSMTVNISEVARQAVSDVAVDIGNSFTYQVVVDLPSVAAASSLNATAEFFSVSATTG